MPTVKMVEYEDVTPEVRAVYDAFMEVRGTDFVPNFWRTLAVHPSTLKRLWEGIKQVMAPRRLDPLTKEMIAIAVSAPTVASTASARTPRRRASSAWTTRSRAN